MNINFCPLGIHLFYQWSVYEEKKLVDEEGLVIGKVVYQRAACKKCGYVKVQREEHTS